MANSLHTAGGRTSGPRSIDGAEQEQANGLETFIRERLAAGDPPGRIAMELERWKPGAGRAFVGQIGRSVLGTSPISSAGRRPQSVDQQLALPSLRQQEEAVPVLRLLAFKPNDDEWGAPKKGGLLGRGLRAAKRKVLEENPQIRSNFKRIVRDVAGESFSERELQLIEGEILDNIGMLEGAHFATYPSSKNGVVNLTPEQWAAVHRLMSTIPQDELGKRVRKFFNEAIHSGRLRKLR